MRKVMTNIVFDIVRRFNKLSNNALNRSIILNYAKYKYSTDQYITDFICDDRNNTPNTMHNCIIVDIRLCDKSTSKILLGTIVINEQEHKNFTTMIQKYLYKWLCVKNGSFRSYDINLSNKVVLDLLDKFDDIFELIDYYKSTACNDIIKYGSKLLLLTDEVSGKIYDEYKLDIDYYESVLGISNISNITKYFTNN